MTVDGVVGRFAGIYFPVESILVNEAVMRDYVGAARL